MHRRDPCRNSPTKTVASEQAKHVNESDGNSLWWFFIAKFPPIDPIYQATHLFSSKWMISLLKIYHWYSHVKSTHITNGNVGCFADHSRQLRQVLKAGIFGLLIEATDQVSQRHSSAYAQTPPFGVFRFEQILHTLQVHVSHVRSVILVHADAGVSHQVIGFLPSQILRDLIQLVQTRRFLPGRRGVANGSRQTLHGDNFVGVALSCTPTCFASFLTFSWGYF